MSAIRFSFGESSENSDVVVLTAPTFGDMCEGFFERFPENGADLLNDEEYAYLKAHLPYITAECTGGERNNAAAQPRQWIPLDIDKNCTTRDMVSIKRRLRDLSHAFYTTAGDNRRGDDQRRFRVLVEISRELQHHELPFYGAAFAATLSKTVEFDASVWKASQPLYAGLAEGEHYYQPGELLDVDQFGAAPVKDTSRAGMAVSYDDTLIDMLEEAGQPTAKGYKLQSYRTDYSSPTSRDDILVQPPVKGKFDQWRIEWLHDTDKREIRRGLSMYRVLAKCGYPELADALREENKRVNLASRMPVTEAFEFRKGGASQEPKESEVEAARAEVQAQLDALGDVWKRKASRGWSINLDTGELKSDTNSKPTGVLSTLAEACKELRKALGAEFTAEAVAKVEKGRAGWQGPAYGTWVTINEKKKKTECIGAQQIAEDIARTWGDDLAFDPALVKDTTRCYGVMKYADGHWQPFARIRAHIAAAIRREQDVPNTRICDDVVKALVDELPNIPDLVPGARGFANGILIDGEFIPHDRNYGLRAVIPHTFDATGRTLPERFVSWLDWVSEGDHKLREVILAGLYTVVFGRYEYKALISITGAPNGGKSVFTALACELVGGIGNVLSLSLATMGRQFALAGYESKALVVIPERGTRAGQDATDIINKLTSGGADAVSVEAKGVNAQSVYATLPVLMAGNCETRWSGNAGALFERIVEIPFNRVVAKEDRVPNFHKVLAAEAPDIIALLINTFPDGCRHVLDDWRNNSESAEASRIEGDAIYEFCTMLKRDDDNPSVLGGLLGKGAFATFDKRNLRHHFDKWARDVGLWEGYTAREFNKRVLSILGKRDNYVYDGGRTQNRTRIPYHFEG